MEMMKMSVEDFFGEVISKYTLEDAIEDGIHADLGKINGVRIIATTGLMSTVNNYQLMHMVTKTLDRIRLDKPNWIVFNPSEKVGDDFTEHLEDDGRTLITKLDGLPEKVYAILEGDVLTFLLASEY